MREDREIELLIDSALGNYVAPASGLEDRILRALVPARAGGAGFALQRRFTNRTRAAGFALLSAAAAVLIAWVLLPRTEHRLNDISHADGRRPVHAGTTGKTGAETAHVRTGRSVRSWVAKTTAAQSNSIASLPKLDVFPTPQPVTAEERALAVAATKAPGPLRQALVEAQSQVDAPLHIAAIVIPPLEPPDEGQD